MKDIVVGSCRVGPRSPPFIIAEMSGNHNQSLERAFEIVDAAAAAGAHALKIQTYTADTMTLEIDTEQFRIADADSLWNGHTLYQLYQKAHTPWEWHAPIFERCRKHGLIPFSTPFDPSAVDFLESLHTPLYKIASFENVDLPLIRKVAATGKPVIISTGMADVSEIDEAVRAARAAGCADLVLLKCTSAYPADASSSNLLTIPHLRQLMNCHVGLSDHTLGVGAAIASVALGAVVIEKHFTLARQDGGVDAAFSLEPAELRQLRADTEIAWKALGRVSYGQTAEESSSRRFRRSLYIVKDLKAGDRLDAGNVRAIRPGFGLPPKYVDIVMGKRVNRDVAKGSPLSFDVIE